MDGVGIFYGHFVYFTAIWYILRPFGVLYGHLVYFMDIWYILRTFGIFYGHLVKKFPFWYVLPRKIWHPWQQVSQPGAKVHTSIQSYDGELQCKRCKNLQHHD
jgi:hypothetical protein